MNTSNLIAGTIPSLSVDDFDPASEPAFIPSGEGTDDLFDHNFFTDVLPAWIDYIITFGAGAAVLMIVAGGVMIMYGPEEEEFKTKGYKTIVWAVVGLFISILSYTIVEVVNLIPFTDSNPTVGLEIEQTNEIKNLAGGELLTDILPGIIKLITQLMGTFAFCLIIYAGTLMVIRDGDEEKVTKAKKLLTRSIVGGALALSAYMIVEAVLLFNFESSKI